MKQTIYNKISKYYIDNFIDSADILLLYELIKDKLKKLDKKIIKIIYIWDILWSNRDLQIKYKHIFDLYPIKIKKHINKYYSYPKKNLIKLLLDFNIETDYETKEIILNILYLSVDSLISNTTDDIIINNNIDKIINDFVGLKLNDIIFTNKYHAYQNIILIIILIELFSKKINKINIIQFMNFFDNTENILLKDFFIKLINYNNNL
jgi:hypothetical protein